MHYDFSENNVFYYFFHACWLYLFVVWLSFLSWKKKKIVSTSIQIKISEKYTGVNFNTTKIELFNRYFLRNLVLELMIATF